MSVTEDRESTELGLRAAELWVRQVRAPRTSSAELPAGYLRSQIATNEIRPSLTPNVSRVILSKNELSTAMSSTRINLSAQSDLRAPQVVVSFPIRSVISLSVAVFLFTLAIASVLSFSASWFVEVYLMLAGVGLGASTLLFIRVNQRRLGRGSRIA